MIDYIVAVRYIIDMKPITYTRDAIKSLGRMPANEAMRVQAKIEQYATEPGSLANNVKALQGNPYTRLRVGDWRVIMQDEAVLQIVKIGPRGSVYDWGGGTTMSEDTVTIPRTEYERLLALAEDAEDIRAADRVLAAVARGEDDHVPAEYANRIIDGEHPLTVYRELRGLSKSELARRTQVHRIVIHDIESRKTKGSVTALGHLAAALGVRIEDLT